MRIIDDFNFKGKKAIIRVDFNVPLNESFEVTDNTRIVATKNTIEKILQDGGSVILMSHLGRPKEGPADKYSLRHVVSELKKLFPKNNIIFVDDCIGTAAEKAAGNLKQGEILLLENLRFYKEEEKGDENFAKQLAQLADIYVNDAFGTAHRAHASTAVIAKFFPGKKYFGYVMASEIINANKLMKEAEKPFVAVMGGAKVSDKILIIENLMNSADTIIIGGGMAFTFMKAMGKNIGNSLCEHDKLELALSLINKAKEKGVKLMLPVDYIEADNFAANANHKPSTDENIADGMMGLDIGVQSAALFENEVLNAKTVLWNGPMGVFEFEAFSKGTQKIAEACAKATDKGCFTLIGGGDSVAAINKYGLANDVSYVSTGGGALLELFEGKNLPGITAIIND